MSDPGKAVFLSYASQDAEAAKCICEALRAADVEVWFDQSELVGGDAWDAKIRQQIAECALFLPVISENTQSRPEGYFRLEWKIAVDRSHLMSDDHPFLVPVVIDATTDAEARVPGRFRERQWTRLNPVEIPPAFIARVKRLLAGEVARSSPRSPTSAGLVSKPATARQAPSRWLVLALAGVAVLVAGIMLWRPWQSGRDATPTTATLSPARELVAKARHLFEEEDPSLRENLSLAEDLLERAEKLDEFDGEVWAAHAQLSGVMMDWGIDRSDERRAAMRRQSDRALQLAPDSLESQLAKGWFLSVQQSSAAEAVAILEKLIAWSPDDGRPLLLLGNAAWRLERNDDAIRRYERSAAFPRTATSAKFALSRLLFSQGKPAEAEKTLDEMIAIRPLAMGLAAKLRAQVLYGGDLDGAVETLKRIPASLLLDERGAFNAYRVWLFRREPDKALQVLRDLTLDFIDDANYRGPKAVLIAAAQEMAGRADLARGNWEFALRQVEEKRTTAPGDETLLYHRALCLAKLGRTTEVEQALRELRQAETPWVFDRWPGGGVPGLLLLLGRPNEALDLLESQLNQPVFRRAPEWLQSLRPVLSLNPAFDPLRDDPRFKALLQRAKAAPGSDSSFAKATADASGKASPPDTKSVAVLAFANLSDDKANEYFSDGISEELLNQLGKVQGLKVAGRTSAFSFKGQNVTEAEIAGKLGVAYVVTGSVQKSGTQVRITARLVKAADGFQVWSEKFTRDLKDIFAVQDEIAGLIAQNLSLKLAATERAKQVVNPEAYRLFLEGRYFWNQRNEDGFARAEAAFTQAIALDPQFAPAHSGLGGVSVIRAQYRLLDGIRPDPADTARARSEAQRAIELDPTFAEPHAVLGYGLLIERGRLRETEEEFQRALALNPNDPVVRCWHATVLATAGRGDAALAEFERAIELDPLWFINLQIYAWELANYRRSREALDVLTRSATLRAEVFIPSKGRSARLLGGLGRKEEALAAARYVRQHPEIRPRWDGDAIAILTLRQMGEQREAAEFAEEVLRRLPADNYLRGHVFAALGRFEEAWPYLQQTPGAINRTLFWDPLWDPLRDDPRWTQLMVKLECAEEYKVARATLAKMQREEAGK